MAGEGAAGLLLEPAGAGQLGRGSQGRERWTESRPIYKVDSTGLVMGRAVRGRGVQGQLRYH